MSGGHFQAAVLERVDQEALGGLSRLEGRAGFSALEKSRTGVDRQTGFQFPFGCGFSGMALIAMTDKHRADFLLEKFQLGIGGEKQGTTAGDPADPKAKESEIFNEK